VFKGEEPTTDGYGVVKKKIVSNVSETGWQFKGDKKCPVTLIISKGGRKERGPRD